VTGKSIVSKRHEWGRENVVPLGQTNRSNQPKVGTLETNRYRWRQGRRECSNYL